MPVRSVRGIVCDVGHVIVEGSILNHVLTKCGHAGPFRKPYDRNSFLSPSPRYRDRYVEEVISEKVNLLRGRRTVDVANYMHDLPVTKGFWNFVASSLEHRMKLLFIGAVPQFLTEDLLRNVITDGVSVVGTLVKTLADDTIVGVDTVVTPAIKKMSVAQWMDENALRPVDTAVIGDSLGDIAMMELVPRELRIAFNADDAEVRDAARYEFRGDFSPLVRRLFRGN